MAKIDILKKINKALSPNKVDFSGLDNEINTLKKKLEETVNIQTVDNVKVELTKFKKKIDLTPITDQIQKIGDNFTQKSQDLQSQIDARSAEIKTLQTQVDDTTTTNRITKLTSEISSIQNTLAELQVFRDADLESFTNDIKDVRTIENRVNDTIDNLTKDVNTRYTKKEAEKYIKEAQDKLDALRTDIIKRISSIGGGAMNRQMFINNVDPLTRYTDMNLKAGSNVTITYQNNDVTKKVDVTISSSGGGGGSTRNIQSIAISQTAGSASGTDYVYLCSGTLTLTMPTTVANTNLYTIKNIGAGIITINTTGGETIDGQLTQIMPLQFTSVDLISNNSGNWNIT